MPKRMISLLFLLILSASCASPIPVPNTTPTLQPTLTSTATQTPSPTETSVPTPTETKQVEAESDLTPGSFEMRIEREVMGVEMRGAWITDASLSKMSPAITEVTVGAATAAEFNLNAMAILFHRFGPGATDKTSRMKDGDLKDAVANYADLLRQAQGEEIDCSELVMNIRANDVRTAGFDYKDMKVSVLCSDETVGDDVRVINNVNVVFVHGPSVENIKLNEPFSRGYGINVDGDSINFYVAFTDQLVGSNNRTVVSGQIANLFYYLESFYGPGSKGEFNSNQGYYKTLLESSLTVQ